MKKTCTACGKEKSESDFYKTLTGTENQCCDCRNIAKYTNRIEKRKKAGLRVHAVSTLRSRQLLADRLKYCNGCRRVLSLDEFSTTKTRHGIAPHCRECCRRFSEDRFLREDVRLQRAERYQASKRKVRDDRLRKKFGITLEQYETLLKEQNGVCYICGKVDKNKSLAVDHDHQTSRVRSLLCSHCNIAIGFLLENVEYANRLIEYIKKWRQ